MPYSLLLVSTHSSGYSQRRPFSSSIPAVVVVAAGPGLSSKNIFSRVPILFLGVKTKILSSKEPTWVFKVGRHLKHPSNPYSHGPLGSPYSHATSHSSSRSFLLRVHSSTSSPLTGGKSHRRRSPRMHPSLATRSAAPTHHASRRPQPPFCALPWPSLPRTVPPPSSTTDGRAAAGPRSTFEPPPSPAFEHSRCRTTAGPGSTSVRAASLGRGPPLLRRPQQRPPALAPPPAVEPVAASLGRACHSPPPSPAPRRRPGLPPCPPLLLGNKMRG